VCDEQYSKGSASLPKQSAIDNRSNGQMTAKPIGMYTMNAKEYTTLIANFTQYERRNATFREKTNVLHDT
jgi:hypothetical protein